MTVDRSPATLSAIASALDALVHELDDLESAEFVARRADEWRMEADAGDERARRNP